MPINPVALEHPRGCATGHKYVSPNAAHRRDYGHLYNKPYYPNNGKYNESSSLASFGKTANYEYGCP